MRADGEAVCCGSDYCGGSTQPRDRKFTDMSAGYFVACDLGAGGGAVCWDTLDISQPSPSTGERFEAKSAGLGYAFGPREDGAAACWTSDGHITLD